MYNTRWSTTRMLAKRTSDRVPLTRQGSAARRPTKCRPDHNTSVAVAAATRVSAPHPQDLAPTPGSTAHRSAPSVARRPGAEGGPDHTRTAHDRWRYDRHHHSVPSRRWCNAHVTCFRASRGRPSLFGGGSRPAIRLSVGSLRCATATRADDVRARGTTVSTRLCTMNVRYVHVNLTR